MCPMPLSVTRGILSMTLRAAIQRESTPPLIIKRYWRAAFGNGVQDYNQSQPPMTFWIHVWNFFKSHKQKFNALAVEFLIG